MGAKKDTRKRASSSTASSSRARPPQPGAALERAEARVALLGRLEELERRHELPRGGELELEPRVAELERRVVGAPVDGDLEHRLANLERLILSPRED